MLWLLIGYLFLFIYRPFEIWPFLGTLRIELLYVLMAGGVWLMTPKRVTMNPLHLALGAFAAAVLGCALASPYGDSCWTRVDMYFKFLVFYLMLVTTVHEEQDLRKLVVAFLVVMTLYQMHSLLEYLNGRHVYRMGIVRLVGVDATFSDPNTFANSILLSLVFVPALWLSGTGSSPWLKPFLVCYSLMSVLCISRTGSRGAFLALLVLVGLHALRSRFRWVLAPLMVAMAPVLWMTLPERLQNRFETIIDPSVGPANAKTSGDARLVGLRLGAQLLEKSPLTGIGPGAWRPATGRQLESHNLYGQLMGEMGLAGIATFAGLLLAFGWNLWQLRSAYLRHPEWPRDFLYHFGTAIGFGVFLLLLTGNFGHNLFRYHWVWYGAFLTIAHGCVVRREQEDALAAWEEPAWQPTWKLAGVARGGM